MKVKHHDQCPNISDDHSIFLHNHYAQRRANRRDGAERVNVGLRALLGTSERKMTMWFACIVRSHYVARMNGQILPGRMP